MTTFEPMLIGGGSGMLFLLVVRSLAGSGTSEEAEGALTLVLASSRTPPTFLMLAWPGVVPVSWEVEGSAVVVICVAPELDVVSWELFVVTRPDLKKLNDEWKRLDASGGRCLSEKVFLEKDAY